MHAICWLLMGIRLNEYSGCSLNRRHRKLTDQAATATKASSTCRNQSIVLASHDTGRVTVYPLPNLVKEGLPTIRSESATELLWQRFSHLQHGMVILFVRELTRNLPPLTEIELHGNRIRPNDAKAALLVTTGRYLSFALRE